MDFREIVEFLKDFMIYLIIIVVVFLVFTFVFSLQRVSGNSMEPTYNNGDMVLLSKISIVLSDIDYEDIVAFDTKSGVVYIKRVIGLPGDTIYAKDNKIYVNDKEIKEEYLKNVITNDFDFDNICNVEGCNKGVIPEDYYFVMGDNREDSIDSRFNIVGLINLDDIVGIVSFKVFPW